ncbi:MAG: hypothetical protein H8E40_11330 [Chloroflexi bacterium]|nr:hypothetical protein [Chloroflexota bacterium]
MYLYRISGTPFELEINDNLPPEIACNIWRADANENTPDPMPVICVSVKGAYEWVLRKMKMPLKVWL